MARDTMSTPQDQESVTVEDDAFEDVEVETDQDEDQSSTLEVPETTEGDFEDVEDDGTEYPAEEISEDEARAYAEAAEAMHADAEDDEDDDAFTQADEGEQGGESA